mgnify:FL=1
MSVRGRAAFLRTLAAQRSRLTAKGRPVPAQASRPPSRMGFRREARSQLRDEQTPRLEPAGAFALEKNRGGSWPPSPEPPLFARNAEKGWRARGQSRFLPYGPLWFKCERSRLFLIWSGVNSGRPGRAGHEPHLLRPHDGRHQALAEVRHPSPELPSKASTASTSAHTG